MTYEELELLPNFTLHYVKKITANSWTKSLPCVRRPVYSTTVDSTTEVEFYAPDDKKAINFFVSQNQVPSQRLTKIHRNIVTVIHNVNIRKSI